MRSSHALQQENGDYLTLKYQQKLKLEYILGSDNDEQTRDAKIEKVNECVLSYANINDYSQGREELVTLMEDLIQEYSQIRDR